MTKNITTSIPDGFRLCKSCKLPLAEVGFARVTITDVGKGRGKRAALCPACAAKSRESGNETKTRRWGDYTLKVVLKDYRQAAVDLFRGNTYNAAVETDSHRKFAAITFPAAKNTSGLKSTLRVVMEVGGWKRLTISIPEMPQDAAEAVNGRYGIQWLGGREFLITEQTPNEAFWRIDLLRELQKNPKRLRHETIIRKFESGNADSQKPDRNTR